MHKVHSTINGIDDESGSIRKRVCRVISLLSMKAGKNERSQASVSKELSIGVRPKSIPYS